MAFGYVYVCSSGLLADGLFVDCPTFMDGSWRWSVKTRHGERLGELGRRPPPIAATAPTRGALHTGERARERARER
jgi:hypothetical protein